MGTKSKIEWVRNPDGSDGHNWNPVTGCTKVSAGCANCYAERMAERFRGTKAYPNGFELTLRPDRLLQPLTRKKPTTYFVNSMSDLFHEGVPFEFIDRVFAVMAICPQHTFQVLTKRPERMREYLDGDEDRQVQIGMAAGDMLDGPWIHGEGKRFRTAIERVIDMSHGLDPDVEGEAFWIDDLLPLPNVWLGTSVEDQPTADARIVELLRCPAAVHFVSAEPLLGPVDFRKITIPLPTRVPTEVHVLDTVKPWCVSNGIETLISTDAARGPVEPMHGHVNRIDAVDGMVYTDKGVGFKMKTRLDWVIVGGESGPGARPMDPDWVRSIRDQCSSAGVSFFFKQWGGPNKKRIGRELDGRIHDAMPVVSDEGAVEV